MKCMEERQIMMLNNEVFSRESGKKRMKEFAVMSELFICEMENSLRTLLRAHEMLGSLSTNSTCFTYYTMI